jgi:hypothetical protein
MWSNPPAKCESESVRARGGGLQLLAFDAHGLDDG